MKDDTLVEQIKFKNPPRGITVKRRFLGGYSVEAEYTKRRYLLEVEFDIDNLEHVNFIRACDGKSAIGSLDGYCMSSGCSCRHPDGSKGIPYCGLFKLYDDDGIKKDFTHQIFGI